jgi:hypothetical protein
MPPGPEHYTYSLDIFNGQNYVIGVKYNSTFYLLKSGKELMTSDEIKNDISYSGNVLMKFPIEDEAEYFASKIIDVNDVFEIT